MLSKNTAIDAPTKPSTTEELSRELAELRDRHQRELDAMAAKLAKGTRDLAEQATAAGAQPARNDEKPAPMVRAASLPKPTPVPAPVPAPRKPETLRQAVERSLREQPANVLELSQRLGAAGGAVGQLMRELRSQGKVYNVGTEESPRWHWIVGDDASPDVLFESVRMLISMRPFTRRELIAATGAREGRVDGAIVYWRKRMEDKDAEHEVMKLANPLNPTRTVWFMIPRGVKPARLKSEIEARREAARARSN